MNIGDTKLPSYYTAIDEKEFWDAAQVTVHLQAEQRKKEKKDAENELRWAREDRLKKETQQPKPVDPAKAKRLQEILLQVRMVERQITNIDAEIAAIRGGATAPTYDRKVITGESCNPKTGKCTPTYQGGTETVSSYYSGRKGLQDLRGLEFDKEQLEKRYQKLKDEACRLDRSC